MPRMRTLLPLLLAMVVSAVQAADQAPAPLKNNEHLPFCRVTVAAGQEANGKTRVLTLEGWYDEATCLIIGMDELSENNASSPLPCAPESILKVEPFAKSPALPAKCRKLANEVRAKKAKGEI